MTRRKGCARAEGACEDLSASRIKNGKCGTEREPNENIRSSRYYSEYNILEIKGGEKVMKEERKYARVPRGGEN